MLKTLVIGNRNSELVDFSSSPWNNASLVTLRHAIRIHWNDMALRKWAHESGERIFVCNCKADDTTNGRSLTLAERYCLAAHNKISGKCNVQVMRVPGDIRENAVQTKSGFIVGVRETR